MERETENLSAVVIGGSGAVGRDLIDYLLKSTNWKKISVIARRKIDRWENIPDLLCSKFEFKQIEELDFLGSDKETLETKYDLNYEGYHSVFCCLGSRTGNGEEVFRKVDYTYCYYAATLCEKFSIPHFSLVSSVGANISSSFLYMRVKGEIENKVMSMNIKKVSIFRPGAILDRDNDSRCGECFLKYFCCCCFANIHCRELALAISNEAIGIHSNVIENLNQSTIYENAQIRKFVLK